MPFFAVWSLAVWSLAVWSLVPCDVARGSGLGLRRDGRARGFLILVEVGLAFGLAFLDGLAFFGGEGESSS